MDVKCRSFTSNKRFDSVMSGEAFLYAPETGMKMELFIRIDNGDAVRLVDGALYRLLPDFKITKVLAEVHYWEEGKALG